MTASDVFLIDTNILVYAHDASDTSKQIISMNIVDWCLKGERALAVSAQNLSEFFSVTTTKKILAKKEAIKALSDIIKFSGWKKIDFNHLTVLDAAKIADEHNMSYWDSLLAATMRQNGVFNLYTENVKDFKVPWLNAVNPFNIKESKGIAKG